MVKTAAEGWRERARAHLSSAARRHFMSLQTEGIIAMETDLVMLPSRQKEYKLYDPLLRARARARSED